MFCSAREGYGEGYGLTGNFPPLSGTVFVGPPREGRGLVERARVVLDESAGDVFVSDHFEVAADLRT